MPSQTRPLMIIIRPWVCLYSFLFPIETCLILLSYCFYLLVFILFIYILFYLYVNYVLYNFVKTNKNDARLKEMGGRRHRPPPTKAQAGPRMPAIQRNWKKDSSSTSKQVRPSPRHKKDQFLSSPSKPGATSRVATLPLHHFCPQYIPLPPLPHLGAIISVFRISSRSS